MIPEIFQYYKFKFKAPDLTLDQASRIEESLLNYSIKHPISAWEEFDYELSTMAEILTIEQFKVYQSNHLEAVRRHEQELLQCDAEKKNEIAFYEEHLKYIETEILFDLYADPFLLSLQC